MVSLRTKVQLHGQGKPLQIVDLKEMLRLSELPTSSVPEDISASSQDAHAVQVAAAGKVAAALLLFLLIDPCQHIDL